MKGDSSRGDRYDAWLVLAKRSLSGTSAPQRCPSCGAVAVDAAIVTFVPEAGVFLAWCSACLRGISLSRVVVNANTRVRILTRDDEDKIPNFELISPRPRA